MTSIQAQLSKPLLRRLFAGWTEGPIARQRAWQEQRARFAPLPRQIACQPVTINDVPGEWIIPPNTTNGTMLYLHGGAYNLGSVNASRDLIARLSAATRCKTLAIDYRLAPEHPFPAALTDATAVYHWLLTKGISVNRLFLAGDSAGGGLAIATLLALRDGGTPLPAGALCLSPWVDLALTGAAIRDKAAVDPILDAASLARYAAAYAGGAGLTSPYVSPLYADLRGLPPLLIQAGSDEILLDDATRLAQKGRQAGVAVTLRIWDGLFHVFPAVPFLPETRQALQEAARFVTGLADGGRAAG